MAQRSLIRALLFVAALYDGGLALVFLLAGPALFARFGVEPPNHWGYVHFSAGLLLVFALMFFAAGLHPEANRNLIPYGFLLKVVYCATVFYHWIATGIPLMWKPFAVLDVAWAAVLLWICVALRPAARPGAESHR